MKKLGSFFYFLFVEHIISFMMSRVYFLLGICNPGNDSLFVYIQIESLPLVVLLLWSSIPEVSILRKLPIPLNFMGIFPAGPLGGTVALLLERSFSCHHLGLTSPLPPYPSCVALGKLLTFSVSQFLYLKSGDLIERTPQDH